MAPGPRPLRSHSSADGSPTRDSPPATVMSRCHRTRRRWLWRPVSARYEALPLPLPLPWPLPRPRRLLAAPAMRANAAQPLAAAEPPPTARTRPPPSRPPPLAPPAPPHASARAATPGQPTISVVALSHRACNSLCTATYSVSAHLGRLELGLGLGRASPGTEGQLPPPRSRRRRTRRCRTRRPLEAQRGGPSAAGLRLLSARARTSQPHSSLGTCNTRAPCLRQAHPLREH